VLGVREKAGRTRFDSARVGDRVHPGDPGRVHQDAVVGARVHFSFLAITLALLGTGAGALLVYVRPETFDGRPLESTLAR
jgi:hypothetical protein